MNLAAGIEYLLGMASADHITTVFILGLVVLFWVAAASAKKQKYPALVRYAPTLLTTVGILGTFVGITSGLIGFDVNQIDESIAVLLAGLKTAFISSLTGMFLAILFRLLDAFGQLTPQDAHSAVGAVGPEEIHTELMRQSQFMEELSRAISADDEGTLLGQIKLLRGDVRDETKILNGSVRELITAGEKRDQDLAEFRDELWTRLETFAEMMSKSATEQVVEALNRVIQDFNRNLTEQFGENFKELNAAVGRLVEWQENYRTQLEEMSEKYAEGVKAIGETRVAVEEIAQGAASIPGSMGALLEVMVQAQGQIEELDRHLKAFARLRDRAVEAIPSIQKQIGMLAEEATKASQILAQGTESVSQRLEAASQTADEAFTRLSQETGKLQEEARHTIEAMQGRIESLLQEVTAKQTESMNRAFAEVSRQLEAAATQASDNVRARIQETDRGLQQAMERALGELGVHLGGVTEKFADDYVALTQQMGRVLAQAEKLNGDQRV